MEYLELIAYIIEGFSVLAIVPTICALIEEGHEIKKSTKYLITLGWPLLVAWCLFDLEGHSFAEIIECFEDSNYWGLVDVVGGFAGTVLIGWVVGGLMYEWVEKKMKKTK